MSYLDDLKADTSRWAFETQLAFLAAKANTVREALQDGIPFVLDRSLQEDIFVFAEHFRLNQQISQRSFETYRAVADQYLAGLPSPDLLIHCRTTPQLALQRVQERQRSDQDLHTVTFMNSIHDLFDKWIGTYASSTVVVADNATVDWRKAAIIQTIASEIELLWSPSGNTNLQLNLFAPQEPMATSLSVLELSLDRRPESTRRPMSLTSDASVHPYPAVYIAAPFTSVATKTLPDGVKDGSPAKLHGRIPRSGYRRGLEGIDSALREVGFHTVLPHRDVNNWGAREMTPSEVVLECSMQVSACDVFVGLLGMSHGSHYEFGLAQAFGKPAIVIHCLELEESFIASGVQDSDLVLAIECKTIHEVRSHLTSERVVNFLTQFVPVRRD